MKKLIFQGVGTALVTPFIEHLINFEEYKKMLEFQIKSGADSVIVCGTTGESATMTMKEKKYLIRFAVNTVNKRIPVIAGTGSNCTQSSIELSQYAESIGADGLLVVTPYYNKATQSGIVEHYRQIASHVSLPIIVYNVPSRTGLNILPETCLELSKIPNIVAIKEASGDISQIAQIAHLCQDQLTIYSGNDDQTIPILSLGGKGVISVVSNVLPHEMHLLTQLCLQGNFKKARELQRKLLPLMHLLFTEVNPIPVKEALNLIGFQAGIPRLPLTPCQKEHVQQIQKALQHFSISIS